MNIARKLLYLPFVMAASAANAGDGSNDTFMEILERIADAMFSAGNLIATMMVILGMFSLYKLVMTFANRNENERDYPVKNMPYYFIGAALGLGSVVMSDVVQETLFGYDRGSDFNRVYDTEFEG